MQRVQESSFTQTLLRKEILVDTKIQSEAICKTTCSKTCECLAAAQATLERLLVELAVLAATVRDDEDRKYISSIATLPNDTTALQERLRQAKVDVLREAADRWSRTNKLDSPLHLLSVMADEIEKGE